MRLSKKNQIIQLSFLLLLGSSASLPQGLASEPQDVSYNKPYKFAKRAPRGSVTRPIAADRLSDQSLRRVMQKRAAVEISRTEIAAAYNRNLTRVYRTQRELSEARYEGDAVKIAKLEAKLAKKEADLLKTEAMVEELGQSKGLWGMNAKAILKLAAGATTFVVVMGLASQAAEAHSDSKASLAHRPAAPTTFVKRSKPVSGNAKPTAQHYFTHELESASGAQ